MQFTKFNSLRSQGRDMEKIKPQRLEWDELNHEKTSPQSTPAGTIAAAIIAAAIILVGGLIGYQEYKEYALKRDLEADLKALTDYFNSSATATGLSQKEKVATETPEEAKERRTNCLYWAAKIREKDTPGNRAMVEQYCYGPGGRQKPSSEASASASQNVTRELITATAKPIQDAIQESFKTSQHRREALLHAQKQQRKHERLKAQLSEECTFWQSQAPSERRTERIDMYCI